MDLLALAVPFLLLAILIELIIDRVRRPGDIYGGNRSRATRARSGWGASLRSLVRLQSMRRVSWSEKVMPIYRPGKASE